MASSNNIQHLPKPSWISYQHLPLKGALWNLKDIFFFPHPERKIQVICWTCIFSCGEKKSPHSHHQLVVSSRLISSHLQARSKTLHEVAQVSIPRVSFRFVVFSELARKVVVFVIFFHPWWWWIRKGNVGPLDFWQGESAWFGERLVQEWPEVVEICENWKLTPVSVFFLFVPTCCRISILFQKLHKNIRWHRKFETKEIFVC